MNQGWIYLHRKLCENWLWKHKPFSYGQAWIDLLLKANHIANYVWVRDIQIKLERGQIGWSEQRLSHEWGWSRSRVRTFLKRLKTEHQIEQQKNNITTVITILNYDRYQKSDSKSDSSRTAAGQQQDSSRTLTINDKECKLMRSNENICKKPSKEEFLQYVKENNLNIQNPEGLWQGYTDGGWLDTQGKLVKNWKLKLRTLSNYGLKGIKDGTRETGRSAQIDQSRIR